MQFRQSQLNGDRPVCPADPTHIVHGNGGYQRFKDPDGNEMIHVPCWNCTGCSNTFSVLPDDAIPYRPISTGLLESELEGSFSGKDPPPRTEKEKGCLIRALQSFVKNIPSLAEKLGQIVKTTSLTAAKLWKELCVLGDMQGILLYLAKYFKTSLLRDYCCLKPRGATLARGKGAGS